MEHIEIHKKYKAQYFLMFSIILALTFMGYYAIQSVNKIDALGFVNSTLNEIAFYKYYANCTTMNLLLTRYVGVKRGTDYLFLSSEHKGFGNITYYIVNCSSKIRNITLNNNDYIINDYRIINAEIGNNEECNITITFEDGRELKHKYFCDHPYYVYYLNDSGKIYEK